MHENAEIAAQAATTVKWSGATVAVLGGLSVTEWLGICGLVVAVIGTFAQIWVTFYYKRKEDRRAQERHDAITAGWTQ